MASGTIIVVKTGRDGLLLLHGYVRDSAVANRKDLDTYFDSRHFTSSACVEPGMKVSWDYDLNDRTSTAPRMRFDSMKLLTED